MTYQNRHNINLLQGFHLSIWQPDQVEGIPAYGWEFGSRGSLKVPSNSNHSVIFMIMAQLRVLAYTANVCIFIPKSNNHNVLHSCLELYTRQRVVIKWCVLGINCCIEWTYKSFYDTFLFCFSWRYGRNCSLESVFSTLWFRREENLGLLVGIYPMGLMNQTCGLVSDSCR